MQFKLVMKAILFTLIFPGSGTVLIPYLILKFTGVTQWPELNTLTIISLIFGFSGFIILFNCIWGFAFYGKGTLATVDPPKVLVVRGLYKYTRNPMYLAVLCILISEVVFFSNIYILLYAVAAFLLFHLFVVVYEEPYLRKEFGGAYEKYSLEIPRWGISFKPYKETDPAK